MLSERKYYFRFPVDACIILPCPVIHGFLRPEVAIIMIHCNCLGNGGNCIIYSICLYTVKLFWRLKTLFGTEYWELFVSSTILQVRLISFLIFIGLLGLRLCLLTCSLQYLPGSA